MKPVGSYENQGGTPRVDGPEAIFAGNLSDDSQGVARSFGRAQLSSCFGELKRILSGVRNGQDGSNGDLGAKLTVMVASTPPATPPDIRERMGDIWVFEAGLALSEVFSSTLLAVFAKGPGVLVRVAIFA
jgi:hypothetical protein